MRSSLKEKDVLDIVTQNSSGRHDKVILDNRNLKARYPYLHLIKIEPCDSLTQLVFPKSKTILNRREKLAYETLRPHILKKYDMFKKVYTHYSYHTKLTISTKYPYKNDKMHKEKRVS